MYQHSKDVAYNMSGFENKTDHITINLKAGIENLKGATVKPKAKIED